MRSAFALGLVAVLTLGTALPVRAEEDYSYEEGQDDQGGYYGEGGDDQGYEEGQAPEPEDYDDALNPYGSWLDDPTYGHVWRPDVAEDWRPYVDGYWAWTSAGWTWVSSEPWGWTFHYGRWAPLSVGWGWVPGFEWGPAWVSWFWDDGFVGWAPLAPFGVSIGINNFVFVQERFFRDSHLRSVIFDHHQLPGRVLHDWGGGHFRAPAFDRIQRVADHPVRRFEHRPPGTLAPWRRHAEGRLHRRGIPENDRHGFAPTQRRFDHSAGRFDPSPRRLDRPPRPHGGASPGTRPPLPPGRFHPVAPGSTRAPHLERPGGLRAGRPEGFHVARPPALPRGDHFARPRGTAQNHFVRPQSSPQHGWARPPQMGRREARRPLAPRAFQPRSGLTRAPRSEHGGEGLRMRRPELGHTVRSPAPFQSRQFASASPRQGQVARPHSWSQPTVDRSPRRPEVHRQMVVPALQPRRVQPRAFARVPGRFDRPVVQQHAGNGGHGTPTYRAGGGHRLGR